MLDRTAWTKRALMGLGTAVLVSGLFTGLVAALVLGLGATDATAQEGGARASENITQDWFPNPRWKYRETGDGAAAKACVKDGGKNVCVSFFCEADHRVQMAIDGLGSDLVVSRRSGTIQVGGYEVETRWILEQRWGQGRWKAALDQDQAARILRAMRRSDGAMTISIGIRPKPVEMPSEGAGFAGLAIDERCIGVEVRS